MEHACSLFEIPLDTFLGDYLIAKVWCIESTMVEGRSTLMVHLANSFVFVVLMPSFEIEGPRVDFKLSTNMAQYREWRSPSAVEIKRELTGGYMKAEKGRHRPRRTGYQGAEGRGEMWEDSHWLSFDDERTEFDMHWKAVRVRKLGRSAQGLLGVAIGGRVQPCYLLG